MNTNIVPENSALFQFVQVDSNVVYIDSRVYCQEVIEVDHGNWMRDTLRKHKETIESNFGAIRFETGGVLTLLGVANTTQNYALLTEVQCNACLVLSKNLIKTISAKMRLVADFERAKVSLRSQLEVQFGSTTQESTADTVTQLKSALNNFPNTLEKVWGTSGIVSKYQVKSAILRDFKEGKDYIFADGILCVNDSTFHILSISFRSLKGTDIDQLPEIINLKTREYFRYQANKKANRLIPQNSEWEQLTLWNFDSPD